MKQVSQEEFEQYIESLIGGQITKVKLAKKLETDVRTLDNKIQELIVTNPSLYEKYVSVLPYKQKGYDHIDFEALLIYALKREKTLDEVAKEFGVSRRTISRRISQLENQELVELYRTVAQNRKCGKKNSIEIIEKMEHLQERDIVLGDVNDRREEELLQIEKRFNELCLTMSKTEAARVMGYADRDRVYKLLNELYKLKLEKSQRTEQNQTFKDRIKYEPSNKNIINVDTHNILEQRKEEEKEEGR